MKNATLGVAAACPAERREPFKTLLTADAIVSRLPAAHAGELILSRSDDLFQGGLDELERELAAGRVRFHAGRLGGALPQVTRLS